MPLSSSAPSLTEDDIRRKVQELSSESDAKRIEMVILTESRYDEAIAELSRLRQENEAQKNYMEQILQVRLRFAMR